MSSESDNEEFFDTFDTTPFKNKSLEGITEPENEGKEKCVIVQEIHACKANDQNLMPSSDVDGLLEVPKKKDDCSSTCSGSLLDQLGHEDDVTVSHRGKRRREKRHKMPDDDDDTSAFPPSSPGESQSSSIDAIFPANKISAPFKVVELDATSVYSTTFSQDKGSKPINQNIIKIEAKEDISLMGKTDSVRPLSKESILPLSPEPDIVASTKSNSLPRNEIPTIVEIIVPLDVNSSKSTESQIIHAINQELSEVSEIISNKKNDDFSNGSKIFAFPPVAPPRKHKRSRKFKDDDTISTSSISSLPVPGMSLLSKIDATVGINSLDIQTAVRGEFIVQSQDKESCKAIGPSDYNHLESDTSQASTPELSHISKNIEMPSVKKKCDAVQSKTPLSESINSCSLSADTERQQQPHTVKEHSEIGNELTDEEILREVSVLNLDTGERIPLSEADECLPSALNPLSLHIMKLTNEYPTSGSLEQDEDSADESIPESCEPRKIPESDTISVKKKTNQIKKFLGKKVGSAVSKAKIFAQEVSRGKKEEKDVFEDDVPAQNVMENVKIKTSHSHKGPIEFDNLLYSQELKGEHTGPIWCLKFSPCGRLLASAGQDHVLRVWVLKQAFNYFLDIRTKWNADVKASPTPSQESLASQQSSHSSEDIGSLDPNDNGMAPFMPKPFCTYTGHSADVLDVSWSNNYFMLTSSMDKTVRLWHISRKECLCIFKHVDFVTAIAFHPKDDRYFISGSLDGKLRLWSIPDKQVVMWNEVEGHPKLITAANFCQNGNFIVVGTYNGRCIFYKTEELKYYTQIHVKSSRGKNARGGRKITGIEPLPYENKLMITSNDSRIRLYNMGILNVCCKYKGCSNMSSQIKAGFSHDGKYIVCGSENQCIYIWKTNHDYSKFSSARKDRNVYWEGVKAHSAVVTCAIFSPRPDHVFSFIEQHKKESKGSPDKGYVLVSADFNGCIKIFLKVEKPKHSSLPASAIA